MTNQEQHKFPIDTPLYPNIGTTESIETVNEKTQKTTTYTTLVRVKIDGLYYLVPVSLYAVCGSKTPDATRMIEDLLYVHKEAISIIESTDGVSAGMDLDNDQDSNYVSKVPSVQFSRALSDLFGDISLYEIRPGNLLWCHADKSKAMKVVDFEVLKHFFRKEFCIPEKQEAIDGLQFSYSSIELTKELLLKFGAIQMSDDSFLLNNLKINMKSDGDFFINGFEVITINTVHHLQNLHLCLRKEELTLKSND